MNRKLYHFTPEMVEELKQLYPTTKNDILAERFNCSYSKICNMSEKYGLKKDIEWVRELSRKNMQRPDHPAKKFWRQKGDTPINKGKKQIEYMTPEAIERTRATRFQKGQRAWNHKEVGYERINVDGYIEVKVSEPNVFKLKQRIVWESINGEIPKGHNIQFRDGNPLNVEPENLYMISRANQLKTENSIHARYPKELQLVISAKAALNKQIKREIIKQSKLQENEH